MRLFDEAELTIVRRRSSGARRLCAGVRRAGQRRAAQRLRRARLPNADERRGASRLRADVEATRRELLELLHELRAQKKTIAGYGAPAKGNTLLQYCGIGPELVPYTVDKSAMKVGLFTPGMHIPVLPVATLLERQPDCVLILA